MKKKTHPEYLLNLFYYYNITVLLYSFQACTTFNIQFIKRVGNCTAIPGASAGCFPGGGRVGNM